jgi:hypothetical protein
MGVIIAKQPNGLHCRISTVVDAPTHYNMTKSEYDKFIKDASK